jgi:SAM-dependent methyltransferase
MSTCLLCGSREGTRLFEATDRLYHTTRKMFGVVRCGECGLIRLDPQPSLEELGSYYPNSYWYAPDRTAAGQWEETYRRLVLRDHVRFVARAMGPAGGRGPLLDVGCGGGLFAGMMRERGYKVLGLDLSPEAAAVAWKRQQVPAVCARLENSPYPPQSVGCLTMFHVLEHLYDPRAYLAEAHRLLERGGSIVVQVPNADSWQFRLMGAAWNGVDVPRHLFDYRARDVAALLEGAGFEVVRSKHFSLRDNPAGMASSLAPGLDPMARRVRQAAEGPRERLWKDLLFLGLTMASLPFTVVEAMFHAGSTVMMEGRRK